MTRPSHRILMHDQALTRGQARRMCRRFEGVGVTIPAARLRQISAGAPACEAELTDVSFAIAATEFQREERHTRLKRRQRRLARGLIVAGLVLLLLNSLLCVAYLFFTLALHSYPY